jgi:adenylate kinase family enzyme
VTDERSTIGRRIQVVGPSCSGKSTLAEELGQRLGVPYVELDALFWKPGWVEPPEEEFASKLRVATAGDAWVIAGNYRRHTVPVYWSRLETVVWLDFPLRTTIPRILSRSWRRWRQQEHLWGTNYERFWDQLKLWDTKESLIAYNVRTRGRARAQFLELQRGLELAHIQWIRLTSPKAVRRWLSELPSSLGGSGGNVPGREIRAGIAFLSRGSRPGPATS